MKGERTLRSLGEGGWKGIGEFRKDTSELAPWRFFDIRGHGIKKTSGQNVQVVQALRYLIPMPVQDVPKVQLLRYVQIVYKKLKGRSGFLSHWLLTLRFSYHP